MLQLVLATPSAFCCREKPTERADGREISAVLVDVRVPIQGNGNYSIGTFNGTMFKEETKRRPCDVGPNFYATQSWHNNDTGDGRRVQTAWMR